MFNEHPSRYALRFMLACCTLSFATTALAVIEAGISVGIRDFAVFPTNRGVPRPNLMTADPNGRLFVNSQRGPLYTVAPDGSSMTTYLDLITEGVDVSLSSGEQGFQSFAFHPNFYNTGTSGFGKFYTIHSDTVSGPNLPTPTFPFVSNTSAGANRQFDSVLLEWSVTDPTAATYDLGGGTAPREVMRLIQPAGNHNAGQLSFNTSVDAGDADYGNLYIAIGDGGSGNDPWNIARDPSNPYGAILRIDPLDPDENGAATYTPANNVFATDGNSSTLAEVFAYGLRNPQRFGWDNADGTMYVADIGQNAREEISILVDGGNYGWDLAEGSLGTTTGTILPIAEYNHSNNQSGDIITRGSNRAITMGEVYRGNTIPELDGLLLTGDFPFGTPLYIDVGQGDPAEGSGVEPFAELIFVDPDTDLQVDILDLIDDNRRDGSNRADLRWSYDIDGRVFVLNKHDGIIRELVTLVDPIALGDFNTDGEVDLADYTIWRNNLGASEDSPINNLGDGSPGIDEGDFLVWRESFGSIYPSGAQGSANVPEPSSIALAILALLFCARRPTFN